MSEQAKEGEMAPEWRRERAQLLETINRQQEDAERLAKRFKLLQRTLVDQQKLLDRYEHALQQQSSALASRGDGGDQKPSTRSTAQVCLAPAADGAPTTATVTPKPPQTPTEDEHRALTAANAARNATSSILTSTPAAPLRMTQETEEFANAVAASGSVCAPRKQTSSEAVAKDTRASWISRKADFHQGYVKTQSEVKPELSTSSVLPTSTAHEKTQAVAGVKTAASNTNSKKRSLSERAPTWAQEKVRMQEAGIIIKTGQRRFSDLKSSAASTAAAKAAPPSVSKCDASSRSDDEKESGFQYVEVVRNRDARAALPGHDCVECRKYYEALNGLIPDADMELAKTKCSRHRARFEPYNTPDDFWRLSFPDSVSESLSP